MPRPPSAYVDCITNWPLRGLHTLHQAVLVQVEVSEYVVEIGGLLGPHPPPNKKP